MASLQYHLQKALGTGIRNPVQKPTILDEFGNKLQNPIHNDESNEANSEYLTGIDNRFSRQEIISGWNQQALLNRRIAVIGTGAIANYFAPSLSVLGAGHIFILGNENGKGGRNEFMHSLKKSPYSSSSKSLEWLIREEINPSSYVEIRGLNCDYRSIGISSFDVVIDATNEPKSKEECRRYCENSKKTFISASSDSTFSYAEIYNPNAPNKSQKAVKGSSGFYEHFRGKEQGAVTSGVAAGLALDFLRKDAFMIKGDPEKRAFHRILYSRGDESRFFYDEGCENALSLGLSPEPESIDKKILIAGAGAIGNFAALELALLGVKNIDIVDFDRVELANANRQILICDPYSIGKSAKKAEVLSEKIRRINPRINSRGIYGRIGESGHFQKFLSSNFGISCSNEEMRAISRDFIKKGGYEMILGCVDNPMARAYLNICAVELGIPYLD
ncbi:MAG: ThiF family adenylyltransferase, partial [Candidatus Woesearchaeota archaeon]|nr:ThiF family adenylyltransferase [Candidatus Woesearchaeota archaeon]